MSVSASPPAAPPAPGSSSTTGATGSGVAGPPAHANGPVTGFEALLAAFFGGQDATGAAAAGAAAASPAGAGSLLLGKLAGALAPGDKSAGSDGKTKTGDDAKAAGADAAGAALDAAQAGLVPPSISALIVVPTPPKADAAAAAPQPGAAAAVAGGADKTGGQAAAATLAQLGAPATGDANTGTTPSAAAQAALAAGMLATDAAANAKVPTPTPTPTPTTAPTATAATPPAPQIQAQPAITEAAVLQPPAPTAAPTPPPPNAGTKAAPDAGAKAQVAKSTRVEGAKVDATAPNTTANLTAKAADPVQPVSGGAAKGEAADSRDPQAAVPDAKPGPADGPQAQASLDTASTTTPATLIHTAAVTARGAPQTVANLAAEIAKKLDGRSTRFDVQLDPAGLGRVDVRVQIGADGKMSASMSFDNPQAAAELKSRAGELHKALEQSGFDLSGGLSFDVASDNGQGRQAQGQDTGSNTGAAFRGRAFQTALDTTADAAPSNQLMFRQSSASGVDIRI